ncbi:EF hand family protein [Histomonas meleagridis]|uniref:EF hand family protein n=1 Tax=Histomonas meleagridis TaxID=135588 RepID=UPI00355A0925|nr:EF hand family protein [Histomonas meleagridis]KAH0798443.1 EF hand family protein [Histomonas meleagridis]
MGQPGSQPKIINLTDEVTQNLVGKTHFTEDEIKVLYKRFQKLSASQVNDGVIDINEFQTALGIQNAQFAQRIFSAFDADSNQTIDFEEFVSGLSALTNRASISEKAKLCFDIYDIDKNGRITKDELKEVLQLSLGGHTAVHLSDEQLQRIIDRTFTQMDANRDGEISLEEFEAAAVKNPSILNCVNLKVDVFVDDDSE